MVHSLIDSVRVDAWSRSCLGLNATGGRDQLRKIVTTDNVSNSRANFLA